jgi:Cytochrome c
MPATEATWRNLKLLHVVFGISSVLLLLSTVWMFGRDVGRQWKSYQRRYRGIEQRMTKWQIEAEQNRLADSVVTSIAEQLSFVRSAPLPPSLLDQFKSLVAQDAAARKTGETKFAKLDELTAELNAAQANLSQLAAKLEEARGKVNLGTESLAKTTDAAVRPAMEKELDELREAASTAAAELSDARSGAASIRDRLLQDGLRPEFHLAKFREETLASRRKFRLADFDAAKADLDEMVRDNRPADEQAIAQAKIDKIKADVDDLTRERDRATAHRQAIQDVIAEMTAEESRLIARSEAAKAELERLTKSQAERNVSWFAWGGLPGKRWLELPILDAFNSPLTIDNLWTKDLTVPNGSFGSIRRFDRCTTCHRGIAKSAPGTADKPAYVPEHRVTIRMQTPESSPEISTERDASVKNVAKVYGFETATVGLVSDDDVTVSIVQPGSLAAEASAHGLDATEVPEIQGLQVGDVIVEVNGDLVRTQQDVATFLMQGRKWGETVELTVSRGLPHPYTSHPRLDLFVGSLSPHNYTFFGCTSCHEGQGGGTDFEFVSHTPNTPAEGRKWAQEHGWFNNGHWIFPMYPARFAESACIKCHHEIYELHPSEKFPKDPAPKVVLGHTLISDYGCFGCHEINGYDGPDRRVGPDMRLEPNYFAAAAAVKADPAFSNLDEAIRTDVERLIQHPDENAVRHRLRDMIVSDAEAQEPVLSAATRQIVSVLDDVESPGKLRKTGPSLRHVSTKISAEFMYDWIADPTHFRPSTKMPRFFGLWKHLEGDPKPRALSEKYEPIEIRGVVEYLTARSQPFENIPREKGTEPASAERGKVLFEVRGCLACHQHVDFPQSTANQGPNLSHLGDKFATAKDQQQGADWLYSWLREPTHYSPRTKMPNVYLDPIKQPDGKVTDAAADVAAYLLSGSRGWKPSAATMAGLEPDLKTLDELVHLNLRSAYDEPQSDRILREGIAEESLPPLAAAESELVAPLTTEKKLAYIGRKTINKYGCFGCHDIPGFEDAKPIGAALADWGRKESAKLAFEHIVEYLHHGHGHGSGHTKNASDVQGTAEDHQVAEHSMPESAGDADHGQAESSVSFFSGGNRTFDESFYMEKIEEQDRSGFIWQKLKEPRSYDYKKTENKNYNERLRMPQFPFGPEDREAIVTFVLGLVADPPADKFVYQSEPRRKAITEGLAVIDKFNCTGCHMFEPERWNLEYHTGTFGEASTIQDFPFVIPSRSPKSLQASLTPDPFRETLRGVIEGTPAIQNTDGRPEVWDEEGDLIEEGEEYPPESLQYPFDLSKSVALDGQLFEAGLSPIVVPASTIRERFPAKGGDLTRWLLTRVVELEKEVNPSANAKEAWGWLPPALMGEGQKVRPEWLYSFLMEPYPIRPSVFLRMPKFNLSPDDAEKLVNYFGARDAAVFPYDKTDRLRNDYSFAANSTVADQVKQESLKMDGAMKIVTDANYCVKCHLIGDFAPEGNVRAHAPDLSLAQFRLRPDYMRQWIANPKRLLHYTPMPVNVPYVADDPHLGGVSQALLSGTSIEQVDALVQLLQNYSYFTSSKTNIRSMVKKPDATAPSAESSSDASGETPEPTSTPVAPEAN